MKKCRQAGANLFTNVNRSSIKINAKYYVHEEPNLDYIGKQQLFEEMRHDMIFLVS